MPQLAEVNGIYAQAATNAEGVASVIAYMQKKGRGACKDTELRGLTRTCVETLRSMILQY